MHFTGKSWDSGKITSEDFWISEMGHPQKYPRVIISREINSELLGPKFENTQAVDLCAKFSGECTLRETTSTCGRT